MNTPFNSRRSFAFQTGLLLLCLLADPLSNRCYALGSVVAWGADGSKQCEPPAGLTGVIGVACGEAHSVAVNVDGTVVAWGLNQSGQASVPPDLTNAVAVAAGANYTLALLKNGRVLEWGDISPAPSDFSNVTAVAAGQTHALALKRDGTVIAWGSTTNVPAGLSNVIAIAAGDGQSLALLANGNLFAWGNNAYSKALVPPNATNVQAIAAGSDHCLALVQGGRVVAWGRNDFGQATVPANLTNIVAVAAGALHSLALRSDGMLISWGNNDDGQISPGTNATNLSVISAGAYHNLAIKGDSAPFILKQPSDQTAFVSADVFFSISTVGEPPLTYQWQHNGVDVNGATSTALVLRNVQFSDQGIYSAKVQNARGMITSLPAVLTVIGGSVDQVPLDLSVICGDNASFSAHVTGPAKFNYQWRFQDKDIAGATQNTLSLISVNSAQAGQYSVNVANPYFFTNLAANLTVTTELPEITSPLGVTAVQGQFFTYFVQATHSPVSFAAQFLPAGLFINPTNGIISGVPEASGFFFPVLTVANACASTNSLLSLSISQGQPVILGPSVVTGTEGAPLSNRVLASGSPTAFGGQGLPPGISVDPGKGTITGTPIYAGTWQSTLWASNIWGVGQAPCRFSFTNAPIDNLSVENVTYDYSAPYLLDFQFSLYTMSDTNDPASAHGVVVNPKLLSALCFEDDVPISSETGAFISQGSSKVNKTYLVLDYTESVASLNNGDANTNGISDAVDGMVNGAISFVNQQAADSQIGVYEFHREDLAPAKVLGLTPDKARLANSIAGIWTNNVQNFPAGSRCWDAVMAAITDLGVSNRDEQHFVVLISDGRDESSVNTLDSVITAATNNGVKVFCVGFGPELDTNALQTLSSQTQGKYHTATNVADLVTQFARLAQDAKGQYILRWATLKSGANPQAFMPSFQIAYQGIGAPCPTNPWYVDTNNPIIDTNAMPPTTNYNNITNFIIGYYHPASNAGPVTVGSLRVVPDAEVSPTGMTLRAAYVPRYIRQLRFHYRANWPCTPSLQSTQPGEMLNRWTMTQSDDGAGGKYMLLSSPDTNSLAASIQFASFGKLVTFTFEDVINPSNAFSVFDVDNTLYKDTGGQSFVFEDTNSFLMNFPALPYGTPVPWLISEGYVGSNTWVQAELLDPDGDGAPNWQEYRANTDPKNPGSLLQVRNVTRQPDGRFQITFTSALNRSYSLEASQDLATWSVVQDQIPGIGQDLTIIDTRGVPFTTTSFYRVRVY